MTDEHPIFIVEKVVGLKIQKEKKFYHVKWRGFGSEENTWEPEDSFIDRAPIYTFERQRSLAASRKQRANYKKFVSEKLKDNVVKPELQKTADQKIMKRPKRSSAKQGPEDILVAADPSPDSGATAKESLPMMTSSGRMTKPSVKLRDQIPTESQRPRSVGKMAPLKQGTPNIDVPDVPSNVRQTRHQIKEALKPILEMERHQKMSYLGKNTIELEQSYHRSYPSMCHIGSKNDQETLSKFSFTEMVNHEAVIVKESDIRRKQAVYRKEVLKRKEIRKRQAGISEQLHLHQQKRMTGQINEILRRIDLCFCKPEDQFLICKPLRECLEIVLILKTKVGVAAIMKIKYKGIMTMECAPIELALAKCPNQVKNYINGMVLDGQRKMKIRADETEDFLDRSVEHMDGCKDNISHLEQLTLSSQETLNPSMDYTVQTQSTTGPVFDLMDNFADRTIKAEDLSDELADDSGIAAHSPKQPETIYSTMNYPGPILNQAIVEGVDESENLENTQNSSVTSRIIDNNVIAEGGILDYKPDFTDRPMDCVAMEH